LAYHGTASRCAPHLPQQRRRARKIRGVRISRLDTDNAARRSSRGYGRIALRARISSINVICERWRARRCASPALRFLAPHLLPLPPRTPHRTTRMVFAYVPHLPLLSSIRGGLKRWQQIISVAADAQQAGKWRRRGQAATINEKGMNGKHSWRRGDRQPLFSICARLASHAHRIGKAARLWLCSRTPQQTA